MKIFDFKLIEEAEAAGAVPGPNRAERRRREQEKRRQQRRGQRAYDRSLAERTRELEAFQRSGQKALEERGDG